MSKTTDNLQAAFAGESQANRKYLFFSEKADAAGKKQVARLFRAAAEAETVHARNHLKVLGQIKTERENLEAAIGGENYEFTQMYPAFIEQAKKESNKPADDSFDLANKVEQIHHKLFQAALGDLQAGKTAKDAPYYVCQVCGNTVEGVAPDRCPICGSPKSKFKRVD
ncbi:MAG TPA: rubrerythrin family protein [Dehalococcoidales bacterium]|nr:MAG: rubrerythrin [Chloroflexi bacterium RBG_16_60_22]HJX12835.1 rubrerythrin family protein [Dehalococcoidales bacterium]